MQAGTPRMAQQRLTINELGDLRRAFEAFDTECVHYGLS